MKKTICLFLALVFMILCACANVDENTSDDNSVINSVSDDQTSGPDNTSAHESVPDISEESSEESSEEQSDVPSDDPNEGTSEDESNLRKGDVERHYPDELCDIWIISKLRTKDVIDEWVESVYLKQTEDEMDQLPAIYQAIKGLDIGRDEFTRVNAEWIAFNEEHGTGQSTYTDEQIEYMFGDYDENEIKQKLKQVTTYYYEGRLYTAYELVCVDDALFNEMIEKGGLEDYSVLVEKYADGDTHYVHVLQKRIRGEDITDE
ncbi:MAG: hypothetical protein IJL41_02890 [Clostridia bacterium]|nr:hypothetical protein [Clostridia bacterium]